MIPGAILVCTLFGVPDPPTIDEGFYWANYPSFAIPVEQCALTAAEIACGYFGLEYDLATVKRELHAGPNGVSLEYLTNVLDMHGVRVEPRRGIAAAGIREFLSQGPTRLALLCTREVDQGDGHVLVLVARGS